MATSFADPLAGYWLPTHLKALYYGSNSVAEHLVRSLPSSKSRAFIITGNSLATKTSLIKQVEDLLKGRIAQHAPVAQLDEATEEVHRDPNIDTIISIGGGSPIDSAKAIIYRVKEKTGKYLTHIAIPTTISAAECTAGAGYTSEDGVKVGVSAPQIAASTIIYDSKFGLDTPYELFASTGMRAMDHAMEIMYHPDTSEVARMIALQAAHKLFTYLPKYKANPKDEAVITQLQIACFTSLGFTGVGLKRSLGLSHTLGYALGSPYGIPHGKTSCLTLGHVIRLKAHDPATAEQIARMAPFIGVSTSGSSQDIATVVGQKVLDLVKELGLFSTLTDWKVGQDQVDIIVKRATGGTTSGPTYDAVANLVKGLY